MRTSVLCATVDRSRRPLCIREIVLCKRETKFLIYCRVPCAEKWNVAQREMEKMHSDSGICSRSRLKKNVMDTIYYARYVPAVMKHFHMRLCTYGPRRITSRAHSTKDIIASMWCGFFFYCIMHQQSVKYVRHDYKAIKTMIYQDLRYIKYNIVYKYVYLCMVDESAE